MMKREAGREEQTKTNKLSVNVMICLMNVKFKINLTNFFVL